MVIKKLIAISVVFALVAGTAFAVDLGGDVIGKVNVAEKSGKVVSTDPDSKAELFKGGLGRIRLEGSGEADVGIGTIGGWLRFDVGSALTGYTFPGTTPPTTQAEFEALIQKGTFAAASGLAWWQPIEQLRLQIGVNPDGHYDASHLGRYGFYAQANEIGLVNSDGNWGGTSWDSAVFGGYSALHFALIITPMEALTINVAIPLNADPGIAANATGDADTQMAATFKAALFQVNYAADFGAIHLTYQGAGSTETDYGLVSVATDAHNQLGPATTLGKFFASAYLGSLVDGLGLEFGLKFEIGKDGNKPPLGIGLAAKYDVSEQFGVKLRSIFEIAMESGATTKARVRVDVLPYFAVNENVTAYFDAGIYMAGKENTMWHIAPYVRVGSEWGPSFYAGINANNVGQYGSNKLVSGVNFAIPVGFIAKF